MIALHLIACALGLVYLTWGLFALVMNLKRVKDMGRLTLPMKVFGYPYLWIGLSCDVLLNLTLGSLVFLELPLVRYDRYQPGWRQRLSIELLLTARLTRHINGGSGWRCTLALWLTSQLLDALDPSGLHR